MNYRASSPTPTRTESPQRGGRLVMDWLANEIPDPVLADQLRALALTFQPPAAPPPKPRSVGMVMAPVQAGLTHQVMLRALWKQASAFLDNTQEAFPGVHSGVHIKLTPEQARQLFRTLEQIPEFRYPPFIRAVIKETYGREATQAQLEESSTAFKYRILANLAGRQGIPAAEMEGMIAASALSHAKAREYGLDEEDALDHCHRALLGVQQHWRDRARLEIMDRIQRAMGEIDEWLVHLIETLDNSQRVLELTRERDKGLLLIKSREELIEQELARAEEEQIPLPALRIREHLQLVRNVAEQIAALNAQSLPEEAYKQQGSILLKLALSVKQGLISLTHDVQVMLKHWNQRAQWRELSQQLREKVKGSDPKATPAQKRLAMNHAAGALAVQMAYLGRITLGEFSEGDARNELKEVFIRMPPDRAYARIREEVIRDRFEAIPGELLPVLLNEGAEVAGSVPEGAIQRALQEGRSWAEALREVQESFVNLSRLLEEPYHRKMERLSRSVSKVVAGLEEIRPNLVDQTLYQTSHRQVQDKLKYWENAPERCGTAESYFKGMRRDCSRYLKEVGDIPAAKRGPTLNRLLPEASTVVEVTAAEPPAGIQNAFGQTAVRWTRIFCGDHLSAHSARQKELAQRRNRGLLMGYIAPEVVTRAGNNLVDLWPNQTVIREKLSTLGTQAIPQEVEETVWNPLPQPGDPNVQQVLREVSRHLRQYRNMEDLAGFQRRVGVHPGFEWTLLMASLQRTDGWEPLQAGLHAATLLLMRKGSRFKVAEVDRETLCFQPERMNLTSADVDPGPLELSEIERILGFLDRHRQKADAREESIYNDFSSLLLLIVRNRGILSEDKFLQILRARCGADKSPLPTLLRRDLFGWKLSALATRYSQQLVRFPRVEEALVSFLRRDEPWVDNALSVLGCTQEQEDLTQAEEIFRALVEREQQEGNQAEERRSGGLLGFLLGGGRKAEQAQREQQNALRLEELLLRLREDFQMDGSFLEQLRQSLNPRERF